MHIRGLPELERRHYRDDDDHNDPDRRQERAESERYYEMEEHKYDEVKKDRPQPTHEEQLENWILEIKRGGHGERSAYPRPDLPDRFTYRLAKNVPGSRSKLLLRLPPDSNIRSSQHSSPGIGFNHERVFVNQHDSVRHICFEDPEELIATQTRLIGQRSPLSHGHTIWRGDHTVELRYGRHRNGPVLQQEIGILYSLEQLRLKRSDEARANATWMGWPSFYAQFGAPAHYKKVKPHRLSPLTWAKECTETMAGGSYAMDRHMFFPPDFIAQCLERVAPVACNAQEGNPRFRLEHVAPEQCTAIRRLQEEFRDLSPEAVGFVIDHALTPADLEREPIIAFLHSMPEFLRGGLRIESLTALIRRAAATGDRTAAVRYGIDMVQAIYGNGTMPWWFNEKTDLAEQTFDPAEVKTPPEGTDAHTWELLMAAQDALGEINQQTITFLRMFAQHITLEDVRQEYMANFLRNIPCLVERGVTPQRCAMVMSKYFDPRRYEQLKEHGLDISQIGSIRGGHKSRQEHEESAEKYAANMIAESLSIAIRILNGDQQEFKKSLRRYLDNDYEDEPMFGDDALPGERSMFSAKEYEENKHLPTTWPKEQEMERALTLRRHEMRIHPDAGGLELSLAIARRAGPLYEHALEAYKRRGHRLESMQSLGREHAINATVRITQSYGIGNALRAANVLNHVLALMEQTPAEGRVAALEKFLHLLEGQKPVSPLMGIFETTTPTTSYAKPSLTVLRQAFTPPSKPKPKLLRSYDDDDDRYHVQETPDPLHATPDQIRECLALIDRPQEERLRLPVNGKQGLLSDQRVTLRDYTPPAAMNRESPSSFADLQQFHAMFTRFGSYRGPLLQAICLQYCSQRLANPLHPPTWLVEALDRMERQYPHEGESMYRDEQALMELDNRYNVDTEDTPLPNNAGPRYSDREPLHFSDEAPYRTLSRLLEAMGRGLLTEQDVRAILDWTFEDLHPEVTHAVQGRFHDDPRNDPGGIDALADEQLRLARGECQAELNHVEGFHNMGFVLPQTLRTHSRWTRRKYQLEDDEKGHDQIVRELQRAFQQEVSGVLQQCQRSLQGYRLQTLGRVLDRVEAVLRSDAQQHFSAADIATILRARPDTSTLTPGTTTALSLTQPRIEEPTERAFGHELGALLTTCSGPEQAAAIAERCRQFGERACDPALHQAIARQVAKIGDLLMRDWRDRDRDREDDDERSDADAEHADDERDDEPLDLTVTPETRAAVQKETAVVSALLGQMAGFTKEEAEGVVGHILHHDYNVADLAAIVQDMRAFPANTFSVHIAENATPEVQASLQSAADSLRAFVFLTVALHREQVYQLTAAQHLALPMGGPATEAQPDSTVLDLPASATLHALTLPIRSDLSQALRTGTLTRRQLRELVNDHKPRFVDGIRERRRSVYGFSNLGGKVHTHTPMGEARIELVNRAVNWQSTPFQLLHANKSNNIPASPTTEEFMLRTWVLHAAHILRRSGNIHDEPELQVCCPGRLPYRLCGVLATNYLLAASKATEYLPEDFQFSDQKAHNGAIISYDAGGPRSTLPFSFGEGRTDVLGVLDPEDARIIQAVHTACMHAEIGGPFAQAGLEFIRRHEAILGDHVKLLDQPWTYNPFDGAVHGAANPHQRYTFAAHAELAVIPTQNLYFDAIDQMVANPAAETIFHAVRKNIENFILNAQGQQPILASRDEWLPHALALTAF